MVQLSYLIPTRLNLTLTPLSRPFLAEQTNFELVDEPTEHQSRHRIVDVQHVSAKTTTENTPPFYSVIEAGNSVASRVF